MLDLGAFRGAYDAAETRAFERRCGGGEAKALCFSASLREREREGGMKHVARGKHVGGGHREGRLPPHCLAVVPERAGGAIGSGDEAAAKGRRARKRLGKIGHAGRGAQRLGGKDRVRSVREQRI